MKPLIFKLQNDGAQGINNAGFFLEYDPAIINFVDSENIGNFVSAAAELVGGEEGLLAVELMNAVDGEITLNTEPLEIQFAFTGAAQSFDITLKEFSAQDKNGVKVNVEFPAVIHYDAATGKWILSYYWGQE